MNALIPSIEIWPPVYRIQYVWKGNTERNGKILLHNSALINNNCVFLLLKREL
jgi:hypothetical protein